MYIKGYVFAIHMVNKIYRKGIYSRNVYESTRYLNSNTNCYCVYIIYIIIVICYLYLMSPLIPFKTLDTVFTCL